MTRSLFLSLLMLVIGVACTDRTSDTAERAKASASAASGPVVAKYTEANAISDLDRSFSDVMSYNFEGAKSLLLRAKTVLPKNPLLLHNLALIYALDKDFVKARREFKEALINSGEFEIKSLIFEYNSPKLGSVVDFYQNLGRVSSPNEQIAKELQGGQYRVIANGAGLLVNATSKASKGTVVPVRFKSGILRNMTELKFWLDKTQGDAPVAFKEGVAKIAQSLPADWNFSTELVTLRLEPKQGEPQVEIAVAYDRADIRKIFETMKLVNKMLREGRTSQSDFARVPSEYKDVPAALGIGFMESVGRIFGYTCAEMKNEPSSNWRYRITVLDAAYRDVGSITVSHTDVLDLINGRIAASEQSRVARIYNFQ